MWCVVGTWDARFSPRRKGFLRELACKLRFEAWSGATDQAAGTHLDSEKEEVHV